MVATLRGWPVWVGVATLLNVTSGASQLQPVGHPGDNVVGAGRYIPLDDPLLPLFEYLVSIGEVPDPSPQVRPLSRDEVLGVLRQAVVDARDPARGIIRHLVAAWELAPGEAGWEIETRAGVQAHTQARRDLAIRDGGGSGGVNAYADLALTMSMGPFVLSARPALENRIRNDPDYHPLSDGRGLHQLYRFVEGYLTVEGRWGRFHVGMVERNWGPAALTGIGISDRGYPRTDVSFRLGTRRLRFESIVAPLQDGVGGDGLPVARWFAIHRLAARVSSRLHVALWEAAVSQRHGGGFDPAMLNPFLMMTFGRQFGFGDRRNVMLGGDATWWPAKRLRLEVQGAIDDWTFDKANPFPNRFGGAIAASGGLGRSLLWRAGYELNSSLAYRTGDPNDNFTDGGVGIGRLFPDGDRISVGVALPFRGQWLVASQAEWLRQGEGRLDQPWPSPAAAHDLPTIFIGTRQDTWQIGLAVSGRGARFGVDGLGGIRQVRNAGHLSGTSDFALVGRLRATIGFRGRGTFNDQAGRFRRMTE